MIFAQVTCRLPEYFDSPDDFVPERWDRSDRATGAIDPYLSLPFGHGRRACIGRRLAEQGRFTPLSVSTNLTCICYF